jgi:L-iditol 2-dehydrogenase
MSQNVKTVSAWKITGPNNLVKMDHVIPATVPAGLLRVKPLYVGSCGSDLDLLHKGGAHSSHAGEVKPIIPGHELCGEIVEVGDGVEGHKLGDIVVVEPALPCGKCHDCQAGLYNCCKQTGYWATPPVDGCYADVMDVLPQWTYKVPEGMDPMVACLAEPLGACVEAVFGESTEDPQIRPNQWTLIAGGGNIAMGVLLVLRTMFNSDHVILAARKQSDRDFALKMGAKHVVTVGDRATSKAAMEEVVRLTGGGVKQVIECTGANDVLNDVIENRILRGYGRIIGVGCHATCSCNIALMRRSAVSFHTVRRSLRKFPMTLQMLADYPDQAKQLIGRVGHISQLPEVLAGKAGEVTGTGGPKTVVKF